MLHYHADHKLKAIGCLERHLSCTPNAEDAHQVAQRNLDIILEQVTRRN